MHLYYTFAADIRYTSYGITNHLKGIIMLLTIHIIIALTTLLTSLVSAAIPKQTGLNTAKFAVLATVLSGIGLALTSNVSLGHLCASGVVVVGVCTALIYVGNRKLAVAKQPL